MTSNEPTLVVVYQVVTSVWNHVNSRNHTIQIDWDEVARNVNTSPPLSARQCQNIWRKVAYGKENKKMPAKGRMQSVQSDQSDIDEPKPRFHDSTRSRQVNAMVSATGLSLDEDGIPVPASPKKRKTKDSK